MTSTYVAFLGDGITREWDLGVPASQVDTLTIGGVPTTFTNPTWSRFRVATAPAAGAKVIFTMKATATSQDGGSTSEPVVQDNTEVLAAISALGDAVSAVDTAVGAVNTAVGSVSTGALQNEVRTFTAGNVPAGFTQIEGSNVSPSAALIEGVDFITGKGTVTHYSSTSRGFIRALGRLYCLAPTSSGNGALLTMHELSASLSAINTATGLNQGSVYGSGHEVCAALADGDLVTIRQATNVITPWRINKNTLVQTALAGFTSGAVYPSAACMTPSGKLLFAAGTSLSSGSTLYTHNVATNTPDATTGTAPFWITGMRKLADGRIFCVGNLGTTLAYYGYLDPTTLVMSGVVESACVYRQSGLAERANGDLCWTVAISSASQNTLAIMVRSAATGVVSQTVLNYMPFPAGAETGYNPYNDALIVSSYGSSTLTTTGFQYHFNYTPQGTIRAKKN